MQRNKRDPLRVFILPDRISNEQRLVDRAEEDLLCAVHLLRKPPFGRYTPAHVCYLLHQSIEKWLKVLLLYNKGKYPKLHNLDELFQNVIQSTDHHLSNTISRVKDLIEEVDEWVESSAGVWELKILDRNFQDNLRYNKDDPNDVQVWVLLKCAFKIRKIVKRIIVRSQ
ncbi:MAG: HEPN domain-containing protein [Candidatus Bathyarchaeota archaeon]|uniref:HEPN domain-containing protein n=1 Tax=Thermoflexus sp. TaxID=1969742 RepID=UPI00345CE6C7|nr:HEPN domain-containing protein [Candidatus Bathyarchaeota archaeon]